MIYIVASIVLEMIIIGGYYILGYDVLNGKMPEGNWVDRVPFYGMAGFAMITLLYVKFVEKRSLSEIGIVWNKKIVYSMIRGMVIGALMVTLMIGIFMITGLGVYRGKGNISLCSVLLWGIAYIIQSFTEEIMCRGFLQTSLSRRVNPQLAIALTSLAFMAPHLSSMLEMSGWTMVVGIVNLLLVSCLFSVIMIKEESLGAPCGMHFGWNFCLGIVFGLSVSGGDGGNGVVRILVKPGHTLLTGGIYGIEASVLLLPELVSIILICGIWIKKRRSYGI